MKEIQVNIRFEYDATCPYCEEEIILSDAGDVDSERELDRKVFNNQWAGLSIQFDCPKCGKEFTVIDVIN